MNGLLCNNKTNERGKWAKQTIRDVFIMTNSYTKEKVTTSMHESTLWKEKHSFIADIWFTRQYYK